MPRRKSNRKFIFQALVDRMSDWPDEALNELMRCMDTIEAKYDLYVELDEETLAAVQEGLEQATRGELASDEEVEAIFAKYGASPKKR